MITAGQILRLMESPLMVKVRNRSVLVLMLTMACMAPPVAARHDSWGELAQGTPDPAESVSPEGDPPPIPVDEVPDIAPAASPPDRSEAPVSPQPEATQPAPPPELTPTFQLPESLADNTSLTIEGSTSMVVITRTLLQRFEATFPGVDATLVEQSADTALQRLQAGDIDIAAIARPLTDEEKAQGLTAVTVSREKIAIIVGQNNPFQGDVDSETFVEIFRGTIANWNQLGGPDLPIRLVDRPDISDTRRALGDYELFGGDLTTGDNRQPVADDRTAAIVDALGDNGISYAIASQVLDQDNVRVLSMHGTLPDDPRYPYSQPRNYVYMEGTSLPPAVEAFLALATNADGQAAVAEAKAVEAADVAAAELPDQITAMRPNGQGFVTGDRAGNLNFWTMEGTSAGEPEEAAHPGPVTALAFSPDGQRLISGGADGTIRFWDAIGTPIGDPINAGNGPVTSLAVLSDGHLISASADGTLQRWDNTGNPVGDPITGHQATVRDMALTADDQTLITAAKDGTIRQWNTADGTPKGEPIAANQGAVHALAVKPDGSFVSGGADGTVRQWDATGTLKGDPVAVSGPVTALAVNPNSAGIAVGNEGGSLQLLTSDGVPTGAPIDVGAPIHDAVFAPNGEQLVVNAGTTPQVRDASGQLLSNPDAADGAGSGLPIPGLPPELADLWRRLETLPPQTLWIIPIALLGLLLAWVLRSWRKDEDSLDDALDPIDEEHGKTTVDTDEPPSTPLVPPKTSDVPEPSLDPDPLPAAPSPIGPIGPVGGLTPEAASASLDPSLAKARQLLRDGVALAKTERHQAALEIFNQAIEAADLERLKAATAGVSLVGATAVITQGLARRGAALVELGRSEEGLASFNRALEMDPNDITAWVGKGHVMAQSERLDEAIFCFDTAIELNSRTGSAWQGKGQALQKMGRDAEARECFAQAQTLGGVDRDIPLDLDIPFETAGETPEAIAPDRAIDVDLPEVPDVDTFSINEKEIPGTSPATPMVEQPLTPALEDDAEGQIPQELQDVLADLPVGPEHPSFQATPETPESASRDVSKDVNDLADPDVPEDVRRAINELPDEPDLPDPKSPAEAPIDVPPDVTEILAGQSNLPSAESAEESTMAMPPQSAAPPMAPPPPPAGMARPDITVTPEQPSDSGDSSGLEGLPPEVLEALKGIPDNSPDSFNIPSETSKLGKKQPPPPPSNPRLRKPPA